jgi:DNA-binding transcriptional MocR family regulator
MLRFIRADNSARQKLAAEILPKGSYRGDPLSFNLWVVLPEAWNRSAFVGHMRQTGIGVVASDAFVVSDPPPEAVRVCICGPSTRAQIRSALEYAAHALVETPALASPFL